MQKVRRKIISLWKGRDVERKINLTSEHFEDLLKLYDRYAFKDQIFQQIKNEEYAMTIDFNVNPPLGSSRWCDVTFEDDKFIIHITPWVLSRIDNSELKEIFGTEDKNESVLIVFEHQLSHLLMLMWKSILSPNLLSREIHDIHGNFYNCITDSFFESTSTKKSITRLSKSKFLAIDPPINHGHYKYWINSCNLDSLLVILLFNISNVFRNAIFTTNAALINYRTPEGIFKSPCKSGGIQDEESWRHLVSTVQANLISDYKKMISNTRTIQCTGIRNLLVQCYPDMKNFRKRWKMYNIADLYALIANMFPSLMNKNVPYLLISPNSSIKKIFNVPMETFTFWDFVGESEIEQAGQDYLWNEIDSEILVFRNGGIPPITNFGSSESEKVKVKTYKTFDLVRTITKYDLPPGWEEVHSQKRIYFVKGKVIQRKPPQGTNISYEKEIVGRYSDLVDEEKIIKKKRAFGETIINGKYEMVGAAILYGVEPGEEGGEHYAAYVKTPYGWYYYDDTGVIWESLDEFPKNVLTEEDGKPEMYFYRRMLSENTKGN